MGGGANSINYQTEPGGANLYFCFTYKGEPGAHAGFAHLKSAHEYTKSGLPNGLPIVYNVKNYITIRME